LEVVPNQDSKAAWGGLTLVRLKSPRMGYDCSVLPWDEIGAFEGAEGLALPALALVAAGENWIRFWPTVDVFNWK